MSKPKKKEYWLKRIGDVYHIHSGSRVCPDISAAFSVREWHASFATSKYSFLRLRNKMKIRIEIYGHCYGGFSVRAIGKPEKI